jgi:hypothetical protein
MLTDLVCLYTYEFWLSLCKIVRNSVILLLPLLSSKSLLIISINWHWTIISTACYMIYWKWSDEVIIFLHLIQFRVSHFLESIFAHIFISSVTQNCFLRTLISQQQIIFSWVATFLPLLQTVCLKIEKNKTIIVNNIINHKHYNH